jgi:RHS repeat-associated protein
MRSCAAAYLSTLFLAAWGPALAQEHPNVAKGFNPSATFAAGDIDNVNLFNGNLVLTIPLGPTYPVNALSYGLTLVYNSQVWEQQEFNGRVQSIPVRTNNAGLGWMVSMGRFNPPEFLGDMDTFRDTYMSPDGARHAFYPTLHEGDVPTAGIKYSRDGSYLRYLAASRTVEFPDGTRRVFDASGLPVQINDRFGNQVNICYTASCGAPANTWRITDTQGRQTQVVFKGTSVSSYQAQVVDRIDIKTFGGVPASYQFLYNFDDGQPVVLTGCRNTDPQTANIAAALLTRLTLPDNTTYSMPVTSYFGTTAGFPCKSGMIKDLTLPTLGKIAWDYINYQYPAESTRRQYWQNTAGVGTRSLLDAAGGLVGTWVYASALTSPSSGPTRELINTTTDPLNHRMTHYFSVGSTFYDTVERLYEYGLPLSRDRAGDGAGRFLSSQTFNSSGAPVRSSYVRYEHDSPFLSGNFQDNSRLNQRPASQRTAYLDDGGTFADETFSDFDGLGHYRTHQTGGNFPGSNVRTSFTYYNPAQGTYGQSSFSMLPASSPWVLGTYAFDWDAEGSSTQFRSYCWDANGQRLRKRVHAANGSAQGTSDVIQVNAFAAGNVTSESWYGGDTQPVNLSGSDFCAMTLPASPAYQINHAYAWGTRATSSYSGTTFKTLDLTIDPSTGLASRSRDAAGLETAFTYDSMGRPLTADPAGDLMTTYTYRLASSASSLARVTVARVTSPGAPAAAESRIDFDAFGRPVKEEQRMPDGSFSARQTVYNALGWKTFVSEQGSPFGTTFLNFDPFGRPGTIRPADGAAHDVTISYAGVRQVSRTAKVATSSTAETSQTTTEVYDRHGRLYEVTEPNNVKTRYDYDAGNRLAKVCQGVTGTACGQTRLFTYDNRGFLTSETHPEKAGGVAYSYDALGHAARKVDGPNDLTYVYDKAERLALVRESGSGFTDCTNNAGHRCLKAFTYATANTTTATGATDYRKGKLTVASRYNYVGAPFNAVVEIKESYEYAGPEGRISRKDSAEIFNGTQLEVFRQSPTWDSLGNLATVSYPDCIAPTVCGTSAPRTVSYGYTQGRLTTVPTFASALTYSANGMLWQVTHSNGVVDTQDPDGTGLPRPIALRATKSGVDLWNAGGTFQYDGSGNLWKQGSHAYTYDGLSRLAGATLFDGPTGGGVAHQQSFSYDNYGNLQSITTDSSLLNTSTSTATNRLNAGLYDSAGNLTAWSGNTYEYDAFNQMTRMVSGAEDWRYIYTADDERFWMYRVGGGGSIWTLRGLDAKVLREYQAHAGWSAFKDYVYRGSALLAEADSAALGSAVRHFHLDHLGTVRAITNAAGQRIAYHIYYPYGQELTAFNQDTERMKFTGHERDLASLAGTGDDLDYMHARHYSAIIGRFTSVDLGAPNPKVPSSWNRYSYALGSPSLLVDPNGLDPIDPAIRQFLETFLGTDLSHVDVQTGAMAAFVTNVARGAAAVTLGDKVFLSLDTGQQYKDRTPTAVSIIGHEAIHTFDYDRLGFGLFLAEYIGIDGFRGFKQLKSIDGAYSSISFEVKASAAEASIINFLNSHPEIASKISAGISLNAADKRKIESYVITEATQGRLKLGLQFINGHLVYVRLNK